MIGNVFRWILHWLGQGLKLWFFATVASICVFPILLPLEFLKKWANHSDEIGLLAKLGVTAGHIACFSVGIAVFTAVLASQLKDHPLRSFVPRRIPRGDHDGSAKSVASSISI